MHRRLCGVGAASGMENKNSDEQSPCLLPSGFGRGRLLLLDDKYFGHHKIEVRPCKAETFSTRKDRRKCRMGEGRAGRGNLSHIEGRNKRVTDQNISRV